MVVSVPFLPEAHDLAAIEERLAGNPAPPSAEAQIAQLTQQAENAVAQALTEGSVEQRAALAQQLEERARWAEDGEPSVSPYRALAAHLRTLKARLESGESLKQDSPHQGMWQMIASLLRRFKG